MIPNMFPSPQFVGKDDPDPYQTRVKDEKDELEKKMVGLDVFISNNHIYATLPDMEQRLLSMQLSTMQAYHAILMARISLF